MNKERRLGRGLEALLGRSYPDASPDLALHVPDGEGDLQSLSATGGSQVVAPLTASIHLIQTNPFQPRRDFDPQEITALADSLRQHGLIQPILVRRSGDGYQLIAGERRLRAAQEAGWKEVPVQIREADDRQMAELAIVENLQRKDLNPLEKAASFDQYLQRYGCTQEDLAGRLSIDRSTIANLIRLLELPGAVQDAIRGGQITGGHARALLPLGDEREQIAFCGRIQSEGLSVRATEQMVQEMIHSTDAGPMGVVGVEGTAPRRPASRSQNLVALEQELRAALGSKVSIRESAKGRGRIVIQFASREEFERLRGHLCGQGSGSAARAG